MVGNRTASSTCSYGPSSDPFLLPIPAGLSSHSWAKSQGLAKLLGSGFESGAPGLTLTL